MIMSNVISIVGLKRNGSPYDKVVATEDEMSTVEILRYNMKIVAENEKRLAKNRTKDNKSVTRSHKLKK